jgi:hypothetical protein
MKTLLAILAVTASMGVAAIATTTPASAQVKQFCDFTVPSEEQEPCVCATELMVTQQVDGQLVKVKQWVAAVCPDPSGTDGDAASSSDTHGGKKHGKSVSAARSESSVFSLGTFFRGKPLAKTILRQENGSFVIGNGAAGAGAASDGGAVAATSGERSSESVGLAIGSTEGSSCAGSACSSSPE